MIVRYWVATLLAATIGYWYVSPHLFNKGVTINSANHLFIAGLLGLIIGAFFYVLRSGFLTSLLSGFSVIGHVFVRQSKALQEENERIRADASLAAWKASVYHHLAIYSLGGGSGLLISSLMLFCYM